MIYILLGAAGSGKGTRAALLKERLGIEHIAMGDLLRARRETDDEIGRTIREKQDKGDLVDKYIVNKVLEERLMQGDVKKGLILDGFPRTIEQAQDLNEIFEKLEIEEYKAVLLEVSEEIVSGRLLNRMNCMACGKIYDKEGSERANGICETCSTKLEKRTDDNEEAIKKRIKMFFDNIEPIEEYYKEKGKFVSIDASNMPERIYTVI